MARTRNTSTRSQSRTQTKDKESNMTQQTEHPLTKVAAAVGATLTGVYPQSQIIEGMSQAIEAETKAEGIRSLHRLKFTTADIARVMSVVHESDVAYQHVHNTILRGEPKQRKAKAGKKVETQALRDLLRSSVSAAAEQSEDATDADAEAK